MTRLLTTAEAADVLRVRESTLRHWRAQGRLACVKMGGVAGPVRYRMSDLEAFIEAHVEGGARCGDSNGSNQGSTRLIERTARTDGSCGGMIVTADSGAVRVPSGLTFEERDELERTESARLTRGWLKDPVSSETPGPSTTP